MISRTGIFSAGFFIVATLAQRLPVAGVPEQLRVTTMWDDVIDHRRYRVTSVSLTLYTQGVCMKISLGCLSPSGAIATDGSRTDFFQMQRLVGITVFLALGH